MPVMMVTGSRASNPMSSGQPLDSIEAAAQRLVSAVENTHPKVIEGLHIDADDDCVVLRTKGSTSPDGLLDELVKEGVIEKKFTGVRNRFFFPDDNYRGQLEVRADGWARVYFG